MKLSELAPSRGANKKRKRVGRGNGSGVGTYSGRGNKGFNCRSGGGVRPGYEGGQMPLHRRLPKRGFTNIFKKQFAIVNIKDLSRFEKGSVIDEPALLLAGLVKGRRDGIKLLANGDIAYPVTVKVHKASRSAVEKIEAAGGKVEVI